MIRPLTKTTKDGEVYSRPKSVEGNIESAIGLGIEAIKARLKEEKPVSADYLKSESLVYLFREARRNRDDAMANLLATALLTRCERILKSKLTKVSSRLHEEILAEFAVVLANDGDSELDYYEVRFNHAFRTHRLEMVRTEIKRCKKIENRQSEASTNDDESAIHFYETECQPTESDDLIGNESREEASRLLDLLPDKIRKAFVLHAMGCPIESNNPSKDTVASLCGVSERTIHNWIEKAQNILKAASKESA